MSEGKQAADEAPGDKARISLYEFYALGIERLIVKAPWELEQAVSAYRERFLTEQRCLGLAVLLALGEEQVPKETLESMPDYEEQARFSVNQAIFRRALKHYFESSNLNPIRADMVIERMGTYTTDLREAKKNKVEPNGSTYDTLVKRVPPLHEAQADQYAKRVEKIHEYVARLVTALLKRYEVVS